MSTVNLSHLEGKLIVSCQGSEGDRAHQPESMARFAEAAVSGGAVAIRANGAADIRAIRAATAVPIIGIQKELWHDGRVLITPSLEAARNLVAAGAGMIALDCTTRGQSYGALERVALIHRELGVPVLADIATTEEALAAARAGARFVLSTMRGYTAETAQITHFDPDFIAELARTSPVPVIAEGRILSPNQARQAISAGAFAVIVGTAITRPRDLARSFAHAVENEFARRTGSYTYAGIDLGGTNTKYGLVSSAGRLLLDASLPTPAEAGQAALLTHLKKVAHAVQKQAAKLPQPVSAIGIATAGWINSKTGEVAYATDNLPGWTGARIASELSAATGLPVAVENDANALAVAEKRFGAGRHLHDFICITLGTGLGAGCYVRGDLNRGAHYFANALGHIALDSDGPPCSCGQRGCLETYVNAAALLRYAGPSFNSAADVIAAANGGAQPAIEAIQKLGHYLARGCATAVQLLDPEAIILSGGLAEKNPLLIEALATGLSTLVSAWQQRHLQIITSETGYFGGVLGGAALAMDLCSAAATK